MFTESETRRISRKFAAAILKALDAFPDLLADADADAAAEIVAGIIKTQLTATTPPPDPAEALAKVMQRLAAATGDD